MAEKEPVTVSAWDDLLARKVKQEFEKLCIKPTLRGDGVFGHEFHEGMRGHWSDSDPNKSKQ